MAAIARIGASLGAKGANLQKAAVPRLQTFLKYAKVELTPPSLGSMGEVSTSINSLVKGAQTGKWTQVTLREATVNALVVTEVAMWFFVGECIGKGSIVGYQIPGAVHFDAEF